MKIDKLNGPIQPFPHADSQKTEKAQGFDFHQVLVEANKKLNNLTTVPPNLEVHLRSQSLNAVETALVTLERYQKDLSSLDTPLTKIDPILQTMAREVNELTRLSERLPLSDPLRKILDETAILSAVEIEKFRRGDYL